MTTNVRPSSVSKSPTAKLAKLGGFRILALRETPAFGKAENPEHAADYWRKLIESDPHHNPDEEILVCLALNTQRDILGHFIVTTDIQDTLLRHPRKVFRPALVCQRRCHRGDALSPIERCQLQRGGHQSNSRFNPRRPTFESPPPRPRRHGHYHRRPAHP